MAGKSNVLPRLFGAALLLAGGLSGAVAEPVRGQSRELGIKFELAGESDWCNPTVVVELSADKASVFQPEGAAFLRMIGRIRAIINNQCPKVERILYAGFAGDAKAFAAEMTKLTQWRRVINLDPETETPACTSAADNKEACARRVAAYVKVTQLMDGPFFADISLTSVMEDRDDLEVGWEANQAFGALKLTRRSEHEGRYADAAAFADANRGGIEEACKEDGGQPMQLQGPDYGNVLAFRSVLCQRPGKPSRLNIVVVTAEGDWFYLFSLWGEEPNMAPANTMATRIAEALNAKK
jgi:hypothetical protein